MLWDLFIYRKCVFNSPVDILYFHLRLDIKLPTDIVIKVGLTQIKMSHFKGEQKER